jgi:tetratricopeptide (TPR) repeat protein
MLLVLGLASACAITSRGAARTTAAPLRVSTLAQDGDARRRASTQLVLDGLAIETRGGARDAVARYEDALKVDANNPLASLALARFEVFAGDPDRGLAHLDRYAALAGGRSDAAAHLAGLRGAALAKLGKRALAAPYLEEARALAPAVWADGRLDPSELR